MVLLRVAAVLALCACAAHAVAGDEAALRRRLAERPSDAAAHARLGELLARRGLPGGALRELATAERLGSRAGAALLADLRRRREEARTAFLAAERRDEATAGAPYGGPLLETALLAAFEAHLAGEDETFPEVGLAEALLLAPELPPWAAPTRARLAGEDVAAAAAAALPALDGAPLAARLLVTVELALAGDRGAARLLAGHDDGLSFQLAAATVARLSGEPDAEAAALARAAALPGGARALARRGDAGAAVEPRWRAILDGGAPRDLGRVTARALPPARPGCRADAAALLDLRRAAHHDVARVDRLASAYVDAEPLLACRAPHVVAELWRAGLLPRARAWAERLVEDDDGWSPAHLLLAEVLVAERDAPRVALALDRAEQTARRRGRAAAHVADLLREAGLNIDAIAAARLALSVAAGAERRRAFESLVAAALSAGRPDGAAAAYAAYVRETPALLLDAFAARVRGTLGVMLAPPWLPAARPVPRIAVARVAEITDEPTLLLIGLADDTPRGASALERFARSADARGNHELARAARQEARYLGR